MKPNLWIKKVQEEVKEKQEKEKEDKKARVISAAMDLLAYTPPEGLFTKSPQAIASQLKSDSKDLKQAMSRLNFYINRAGDNLTGERRDALETAKDKLRGMYKDSSISKDAIGRPPKAWWDKMKKDIKKNEPSYSEEILNKTLGDIWYNKLTDSKRKEILGN